DPHVVVVAMRHFHLVEGTSAIARFIEVHVRDVDHIGRLRIRKHVLVVPCALPECAVVVYQLPGLAAVIGAVESALGSFDDGIHSSGTRAYSDPMAAMGALGQSVLLHVFPGSPAVIRAVKTAAGAAA